MGNQDNMIFGNGIEFVRGLERGSKGHTPKVSDQDFSEALQLLVPQVKQVVTELEKLNDDLKMPNSVISLEIKPQYLSKSSKITEIYNKSDLERIGSLPIKVRDQDAGNTEKSRIEYLRGSLDKLDQLFENMSNGKSVTQRLRAEIVRIKEIGLATVDEKLKLIPGNWQNGRAYLVLHPMVDQQLLLAKIKRLLPEQDPSSWKIFQASDGLTYLSLTLTRDEVNALAPFNALRQIMPKGTNAPIQVEGGFTREINLYEESDYSSRNIGELSVGQIDGGIRQDANPYLQEIREIASVEAQPTDFFQEHGTAVGSVLLYGDLNDVVPGEKVGAVARIKSIRVLPTGLIKEGHRDVEDFDFVEAAALIKEVVPQHADVKVWNISVGPFGPALVDGVAGPLTEVLDHLAFKYRILFCVAVGNTGGLTGEWARIQTPADMVNGLAVGSFYFDEDNQVSLATYTSVGPGREGGVIKPDILAHGGAEEDKILTFSTSNYALNQAYGSSFAAPLVARDAIQLINTNPSLTPLDARALIIHNASLQNSDIPVERGGHGSVLKIEDVLHSGDNEYRMVYSSEMSTESYVRLDIPLPDIDNLKSKSLEFAWTVCVLSEVSASEVDEYAQYTAEVGFYPDAKRYEYRKAGHKPVTLNSTDPQVERLLADGWNRSAFPSADGNKKYKHLTEQSLRDKLKWDTVKSDRVNKHRTSLDHPFLVLHGLSRNGSHIRIPYSVVLTVRAKDDNDLYQLVKAKYPVLLPLQNVARNRV